MLYVIAGLFVVFHIFYTAYFIKKYLRFKKLEKKSEKMKKKKLNNNLKGKKQIHINKTNNINTITTSIMDITTNNNSNNKIIKNQSNHFVAKNQKEISVKYRNLTESPDSSNSNLKSKINQNNNLKK